LKGGNDTKRRGLRFLNHPPQYTPPTRDPYAMDVDRLSIQEQANHMKKGLCFVCHLPGHRASDHGSGGSGPPPTSRRQYTPPQTPPILTSYPAALKKADGAYARIKKFYENLSEEEKRKLTDSCYGTASCLISSHLINHTSPILSNELSNTYLISVWLLWNSSLFNLLHFIIVWSCGHYYKV